VFLKLDVDLRKANETRINADGKTMPEICTADFMDRKRSK